MSTHANRTGYLAYLVYTSGSTGEPKAVLLQHRGLANFVRSQVGEIGIGKGSRVLQFASLTFDASITEIFPALVSGSMVCLAAHEQLLGGVEMERLIQQNHINLAILPPSALRLLSPEAIPDLETVVAAGESCSQTIVRDWSKGRHLYNAYGPTEATVGPLLFKTEQKDSASPVVSHATQPAKSARAILRTPLDPADYFSIRKDAAPRACQRRVLNLVHGVTGRIRGAAPAILRAKRSSSGDNDRQPEPD